MTCWPPPSGRSWNLESRTASGLEILSSFPSFIVDTGVASWITTCGGVYFLGILILGTEGNTREGILECVGARAGGGGGGCFWMFAAMAACRGGDGCRLWLLEEREWWPSSVRGMSLGCTPESSAALR